MTKHSFLVVDDETPLLDSIYDLFRREYVVFRACNAAEARAVLRSEDVHILMSDEVMPGTRGVELLREVKEEYPDVVRLLFTGYADLQSVARAINVGQIFRYVMKPPEQEELQSVLRQAAEYYELVQDRKRLIAELQKANDDLRTASALKSAFLDVASHELNTPVMILLGMSELAQERITAANGEGLRRQIEVLRAGALRLKHLVENMLKLLQAGSFETRLERRAVDCQQMLDAVCAQVAPFLERRRQQLPLRVEPADARLYVDRGKMHDVVLNLVMNAIKFSPDGSVIELSASAPPEHAATIEVADSGVGISERDRSHIFEPFFSSFDTLHHSSGSYEYGKRGLGMGLAIVKKFVEMHGGSIEVQARPPRGTRFVIHLPPASAPGT